MQYVNVLANESNVAIKREYYFNETVPLSEVITSVYDKLGGEGFEYVIIRNLEITHLEEIFIV